MRFILLTIVSCHIVAAGCSHIPEPAAIDPRVEPAHILRSIRCEIGKAVIQDYPKSHWVNLADIAYGLTLRAEENNAATAAGTFFWPLHLGNFTLGFSAGSERFKVGENIVNMAEGIADPVKDAASELCAADEPRSPHAYPILGSLGMREVIRKFVDVNGVGHTQAIKEGGFTQTMKFHLKFLGGIKPSFAIKPLDKREISGSIDLKADRKDIHELIVKLAPRTIIIKKGKRSADGEESTAPDIRIVGPDRRRQLLNSIEAQQDRDRLGDALRDAFR